MSDVAVTGIGVVSAFGVGADALWDGLVAGRSGLVALDRFPAPPGALAGAAPVLDVRSWAHTPQGRRIDRTSLLALAACRLALADAGACAADPARTGLVLGSGLGNLSETAAFLDRLFARGTANPLVFPNLVMNAPLSYASIELGVTGPTACLTEQEATGEAAVAWGTRLVADGAVDVCLAGAADELDAVRYEVLAELGVVAGGAPHPLDAGADGLVPGEGGAVLVLEPMARARARGARVYARLVAPEAWSLPAPVHGWPTDPRLLAAQLAPLVADADLIVAAASGEPVLDALEGAALAGAAAGRTPAITAPRGATGDFGAAGALAAAIAALAVHAGVVPPTLGGTGRPRASLSLAAAARSRPVRAAVVDGLARGGACQPLRLEAA